MVVGGGYKEEGGENGAPLDIDHLGHFLLFFLLVALDLNIYPPRVNHKIQVPQLRVPFFIKLNKLNLVSERHVHVLSPHGFLV